MKRRIRGKRGNLLKNCSRTKETIRKEYEKKDYMESSPPVKEIFRDVALLVHITILLNVLLQAGSKLNKYTKVLLVQQYRSCLHGSGYYSIFMISVWFIYIISLLIALPYS